MLKRKQIPSLAGGLNDSARSDIIEDDQTQVCTNFEINNAGILTRRKAPETYDTDLQTAIDSVIGTLQNFFVWYPEKLPKDISDDTPEVYVCYGVPAVGEDQELHIVYLDDGGSYASEQVSISGVNYSGLSKLVFVESPDKLIILDWDGNNDTHFITYDDDGELMAGKMGIEAPKAKPDVEQVTEWKPNDWEENSTQDRMTHCGLIQFIYICVTEDGEYSNPSPISDTLDMQFMKLSDNLETERWVNKASISNLTIPDTDDFTKDKLKYFNIYYRNVTYSEGRDAGVFYFAQQFEIADKENVDTDTSNNYDITVENVGDAASWENDIAPIANAGVSVSQMSMLCGIKRKIHFPFEFQYYAPIHITNNNSITYIDAIIRIRISEDDIDHLELDNYIAGSVFEKTNHIKLYDTDLTTPIVAYCDDISTGSSGYLDLYIKIPQLTGKEVHTIYLCFNSDLEDYEGVNIIKYTALFNYGRWTNDWDKQVVFTGGLSVTNNTVIASRMEENGWWDDDNAHLVNRSNFNSSAIFDSSLGNDTTMWRYNNNPAAYPVCLANKHLLGTSAMLRLEGSPLNSNEDVKFEIIDKGMSNLGYISMYIRFAGDDTYGLTQYIRFVCDSGRISIDITDDNEWLIYLTIDGEVNTHTTSFTYPNTSTFHNYFVLVSWNFDDSKASIFVFSDDGTENHEEFEIDEISLDSISPQGLWLIDDEDREWARRIDQIQLMDGIYLSADDGSDDINRVCNIGSFMPPFETFIGYDYSSHNNNIVFDEVRSVEYKVHKNRIIWSEVGAISFPDLNYKDVIGNILRIEQSPFESKGGQYTNSVYIWTRNRIYIFLLTYSEQGWAASVDNIIQGNKGYGLYAEKTLAKDGDVFYWLSESGICRMQNNQIKIISDDKYGNSRIDLGTLEDPDNYIGFINKTNHQYILHKQTTESGGFLLTEGGDRIETEDGYYVTYED